MGFHENKRWTRLWSQHPSKPTTRPKYVGANSGETTLERVKPNWCSLPFLFSPHYNQTNGDVAKQNEGIRETPFVFFCGWKAQRAGESQG